MKFKAQTTYTTEINDVTVRLTHKPVEHIESRSAKIGDRLILAYATQDEADKDLIGDGMGMLYSLRNRSKTCQQARTVLGLDSYGVVDENITPDKDAVLLDCYEHGGQHWFVSGDGTQCRFDTARGAGVWVPDECLRKQLDDDEAEGVDRRASAITYAKQFLEQYNAIIGGEVYGIVTEVYDESGGFISCDHVWGVIGQESAEEEIKGQFELTCKGQ